jgi:general stress protein YciG
MSKELPFFKFNATQWLTGNINYETFETQGAFIRLCAEYWNRSNEMTYQDAILRINDAKLVDYLIEKEYIKVKNKKVFIKFLDEEKIDIGAKRLKLSEAGRKGGLSSAEARLKGGSSIIEEDKEEEEYKEEKGLKPPKNKQPFLEEVIAYFNENNYTTESATKAFNYYHPEWKDSQGKRVLNWKQKMRGVWFKDENLIKGDEDLTLDQQLYRNVMAQINNR